MLIDRCNRPPLVRWLVLPVLAVGFSSRLLPAQGTNALCEDVLEDPFTYSSGDLEGQGPWNAITASSATVKVVNGNKVEAVPATGAANHAWFRPLVSPGDLRSWGLDRVYRRYHSVEFDLKPKFPGSGSNREGWFSVYLTPDSLTAAPFTMDSNPPLGGHSILIACRLMCKDDGSCAAEYLGRVLHPSLVIEAESPTTSAGSIDSEANNVIQGAPPVYYNGGTSLFNLDGGDRLTYLFQAPTPDQQTHDFNILLRLGNEGTVAMSVDVTIDPGPGQWTTTLTVNPTNHRHDYVILNATVNGSVTLQPVQHTLQLDFPGSGPLSIDSIVFKHTESE